MLRGVEQEGVPLLAQEGVALLLAAGQAERGVLPLLLYGLSCGRPGPGSRLRRPLEAAGEGAT